MEDFIRLLAKQQSLSGRTSLITMYITPNGLTRISCRELLLCAGIISVTCNGYKGSVLTEPERAVQKAD